MNLSPNDLPAFLLSKILLAYCYNPKATILPNHGKDPFDAQLTLHLVDYLNSNELRRFMKWMQDFLIAEFSFEFFHLESYYNEDSIVANSVREMTPNGLERLLASYQENFPLVPMPEVLQDPILWQHVSETIIEDALCSPLAESYKQYVIPKDESTINY